MSVGEIRSPRDPMRVGGAPDQGGPTWPGLEGGLVRKGGHNPPVSQIKTRPGRPAPMRPANARDESGPKGKGE